MAECMYRSKTVENESGGVEVFMQKKEDGLTVRKAA